MRRKLILLCIIGQLLVLGVMAGEREWILATGQRIFLRTAPVDPRDPFRGDFVRLDYAVNQVPSARFLGKLAERQHKRGDVVYALLGQGPGDLFTLEALTDELPAAGTFLRGRVVYDRRGGRGADFLRVDYGIEQMFVEQGSGREIEQRRGTREGLQVPMEVEVAVSSGGTAVIRGYRWSRLAMGLKMVRFLRRDRNTNLDEVDEPLSPKLEITLQNVSDRPLVIADPGEHCAFQLRPTVRVSRQYRPSYSGCDDLAATIADFVTLAPGEPYTVVLDLSDVRWHQQVDGKIGEIGRYAANDSFRIVYQAPAAVSQAGDAGWQGELPSSAFTAFRLVD